MNDSSDSSQPEFGDIRFACGKTPWDFHGVPATLKRFLKTSSPGKALIPGCGTGYEVRAFHQASWDATAIDFSPVAVEQARVHLGELGRCVILGVFFKHGLGEQCFDLIYERTFLCALPPQLWRAYTDRMAQLLRPGGRVWHLQTATSGDAGTGRVSQGASGRQGFGRHRRGANRCSDRRHDYRRGGVLCRTGF